LTKPVTAFVAIVLALNLSIVPISADDPTLKLRAVRVGAAATEAPLTIELFRWSTDAERAPLLAALSAPPPAPPVSVAAPAGRAGRGGRGGRGPAPPLSRSARLTAAVKAAPTFGFIWGGGPTGYSIKYAWHSTASDGTERIVLVTDRRLGAHQPPWPQGSAAAGDADFTVIEARLDGRGRGEGKTSLTAAVVVDAAAKTLTLDAYAAAPALLEVRR
jgi:hypothetical protein